MAKRGIHIVVFLILFSIFINGCTTQEVANTMKEKYENINSYSAHQTITNAFGDVVESDIIVKRLPDKKLFKETFPNGDVKIIQDLPNERIIYTYDKSENTANKVVFSYRLVGENKEAQTPDFLGLLLSLWEYADVGVEDKKNMYIINVQPKEKMGYGNEKYYIDKESFIPIKIEYLFSKEDYENTKDMFNILAGKEIQNIKKVLEFSNLQTNIPISDDLFELPFGVNIIIGPTGNFNLELNYQESFGNINRWDFIVITPNKIYPDNLITSYRYSRGKADGIEYKKADIKTKFYEISEGDSFSFWTDYFSHYGFQKYAKEIEKTEIGDNIGVFLSWEKYSEGDKMLTKGNQLLWKKDNNYYWLNSNNYEFSKILGKEELIAIAKTMDNVCGDNACGDFEFDICPEDCVGVERPIKNYEYQLEKYGTEPNTCNNNICEPGESIYNCPEECSVDRYGIETCSREVCSDKICDQDCDQLRLAENPYIHLIHYNVHQNGVIFSIDNKGNEVLKDFEVDIKNCNIAKYTKTLAIRESKQFNVGCCMEEGEFYSPIILTFKNKENDEIKIMGFIHSFEIKKIDCPSGKFRKIEVTDAETGIKSCQYDCAQACTTFEDCPLGGYIGCPDLSTRKAWNCVERACEYIEDPSCT